MVNPRLSPEPPARISGAACRCARRSRTSPSRFPGREGRKEDACWAASYPRAVPAWRRSRRFYPGCPSAGVPPVGHADPDPFPLRACSGRRDGNRPVRSFSRPRRRYPAGTRRRPRPAGADARRRRIVRNFRSMSCSSPPGPVTCASVVSSFRSGTPSPPGKHIGGPSGEGGGPDRGERGRGTARSRLRTHGRHFAASMTSRRRSRFATRHAVRKQRRAIRTSLVEIDFSDLVRHFVVIFMFSCKIKNCGIFSCRSWPGPPEEVCSML